MPIEPFLVNPPKKLPKRKNPLPGRLLSKMQRKYGRDGMSAAWKSTRSRRRSNLVENPLAETLMIVGTNPRRRRNEMLDNAWYGHPLEHRRAALKGWRKRKTKRAVGGRRKRRIAVAPRRRAVARKRRTTRRKRSVQLSLPFTGTATRRYLDNPRRRRRGARRRRMLDNPRRSRRRMRRNPIALGGIMGSVSRALPLAVTGGASIIVTNMAPGFAARFVGTSNIARYGVQFATAVGGGIGVGKFVGREHGTIWTVAGLAVIVADLANKYILGRALAGLGAEYEIPPAVYGMGAFPYEEQGVGAYPEDVMMSGPYDTAVGPY